MHSFIQYAVLVEQLLGSRNTVEKKAEFAPTESMF